MSRFPRQSSSIVNRDFIIEEDLEEDLTTPMERGRVPESSNENDFSKLAAAVYTQTLPSLQNNRHNSLPSTYLQQEI